MIDSSDWSVLQAECVCVCVCVCVLMQLWSCVVAVCPLTEGQTESCGIEIVCWSGNSLDVWICCRRRSDCCCRLQRWIIIISVLSAVNRGWNINTVMFKMKLRLLLLIFWQIIQLFVCFCERTHSSDSLPALASTVWFLSSEAVCTVV